MESQKLAKQIARLTSDKKAYDIIIMELKGIASFTDYFVICSADSDTQVKAIADYVIEKMKENGVNVWHSEGYESLSWVLLDYVDVVVHIFLRNTRNFYNIEKIWGDANMEYVNGEGQKVSKHGKIKKGKNA